MKFKVGEVWRTRDGRKARILATDSKQIGYPIVVLVQTATSEGVRTLTAAGMYLDQCISYCDLIEPWRDEPEEVEVFEWLSDRYDTWGIHDCLMTEEQAKEYFGPKDKYRKTGRSWKVPK